MKMIERLNQYCKKKKIKLIIFLFPQILLLTWLIMFKHIYYVMNDDIVINAMASGGYGKPTQYLCVISPVFGYILKGLFVAFPVVNWLGIVYIVLTFISFLLIDIVFSNKDASFFRTLVLSFLVFNCSFLIWTYFTFSTVAYACSIGGLLWCMDVLRKKNKILTWKIVPGWVLLSFCMLIRGTAIYSLIIAIGFYAVYELCFKKNWRLFLLCILIFSQVQVVKTINSALNEQSKIQSDYIKWNSSRSFIGDYLTIDIMEESSLFSAADAKAFFNTILWDKELFSTENMTRAAEGQKKDLRIDNAIHFYREIINMFKDIISWDDYFCYYFIIFWVVSIFEIIIQKESRKQIVAIMFGALSTSFLFFVLGRSVYRILMPGYLFAILCILWVSNDRMCKKVISIYGLILIVIEVCMIKAYKVYQFTYNPLYEESNYKVVKYLEENKTMLFLPCVNNIYSLEMVKDILYYDDEYISNLIGNWSIYSESYYELMKLYNIKNPDRLVVEIPDSNIIRLVMLNGEIPDYIIDFIEERTGKKVETQLEDVINDTGYGDWYFYSVYSK